MRTIKFLVGDLEVPHVGITKVGKVVEVCDFVGESLVAQGVAEDHIETESNKKNKNKEVHVTDSISMDEK